MRSKAAERQRKIRKRVLARNRRFHKLGKSAQRMRIIKDVIASLASRKYKAKTGLYTRIPDLEMESSEQLNIELETMPLDSCHVCGIGGLFLSAVALNNKFTIHDYNNRIERGSEASNLRSYLKVWFNEEQLDLVEAAFERSRNLVRKASSFSAGLAVDFGLKYNNPKQRLLAICNNIVSNKGKFIPPNVIPTE